MQDLHLIGVHEDGEHLLLGDGSGGEFRLRLDEALRRAARHEPRPAPSAGAVAPTLGPREVQAMIRAGASPEEAAERAGWSVEKVHRFDGPILAERGHIAALAVATRLRGRYGEAGSTLAERVAERLHARGVTPESLAWDSWRSEDGQWTVVARYSAGGRAREASWEFSRHGGHLQPLDDEALWLSAEEEQDGPIGRRPPGPSQARAAHPHHDGHRAARAHRTDSSGEGRGGDDRGRAPQAAAEPVQQPSRQSDGAAVGPASTVGTPFEVEQHEDPFDLMDSVRQHSAAQRRRGGVGRRGHRDAAPGSPGTGGRPVETSPTGPGTSPTALPPAAGLAGDAALPLADLGYDPETMAPPPGAHSHPVADGVDGRPEPAAAEAAAGAKPPRARRTSRVGSPRNRPAEAAEPEPVRTKRRRPAAFPGALDPDPIAPTEQDVAPADDPVVPPVDDAAPADDADVAVSATTATTEASDDAEDTDGTASARGADDAPAPASPGDVAENDPAAADEPAPADVDLPEPIEAEESLPPVTDPVEEPQLPWDEAPVAETPAALGGDEPPPAEQPPTDAAPAPAMSAAPAGPAASSGPGPDTEPAPVAPDDQGAPAAPAADDKAAGARRRGRSKARASVPSWDDIMFGSRKE